MKKIYFFIFFIIFIGCSSKETQLHIPLKGNKNNFHCKNIKVNSNNHLLKKILNEEIYNIILFPNSPECTIYLKNNTKKQLNTYKKNIKIIYTKKHPRCKYYKQSCILKGNNYFCSQLEEISYNEFNKIKHFKYRYQNLYINDINSNIFYKISSRCNPLYIYIKCKKAYFKIDNKYYLNKKLIYNQNDFFEIDPCKELDSEVFYDNIQYIINQEQHIDYKIKNSLTNFYKKEIKEFIFNNFPHLKEIEIDLIDPNSNDKIENIYQKLINNKTIDYNDLNILNNYSKKIKNIKEYIAIEILKIVINLKLNLINNLQIQHKTLKQINNLINISKKHKLKKYIKILEKLKNLIQNIEINR